MLLLALGGLMVALGALFAGTLGALAAGLVTAGLYTFSVHAPTEWLLRRQGARALSPWQAPGLSSMFETLARRAGLGRPPRLYLTPGLSPNAFTVGESPHAAVVVSAGLLRLLDDRELAGVLAHEIAHVKHRDTRTLRLAATFDSVVAGLSRAGWFMLLLSLPLMLVSDVSVPALGVLLLVVAPSLSRALQLALSRTREYAADEAAVALTRDPRGLASALVRLEASQRGLLGRLFGLTPRLAPQWMRTHPATERRVARLLGASPPSFGRAAASAM